MQTFGIINTLDFYHAVRSKFPAIDKLPIWTELKKDTVNSFHTSVVSAMAGQIIEWTHMGEYVNAKQFLDDVEHAFLFGDDRLVALFGTTFVITIEECKDKNLRDKIEEMMGTMTSEAYQINLRGHRESN